MQEGMSFALSRNEIGHGLLRVCLSLTKALQLRIYLPGSMRLAVPSLVATFTLPHLNQSTKYFVFSQLLMQQPVFLPGHDDWVFDSHERDIDDLQKELAVIRAISVSPHGTENGSI